MMGKIKRSIRWGLGTIIILMIVIWFSRGVDIYKPDGSITSQDIKETMTLLNSNMDNARYTYVDYLSDHQQDVDHGLSSIVASLTNYEHADFTLTMSKDKVAIYEFNIET